MPLEPGNDEAVAEALKDLQERVEALEEQVESLIRGRPVPVELGPES